MIAAARTERRSLNVFAFTALCFAATFAWDVAYASLSDHGAAKLLEIIPGPVWFALPVALNAALGFATGQWRESRSGWSVAAAAGWCIAAPSVAIFPFLSFMCFAFKSCFGD